VTCGRIGAWWYSFTHA